LSSNHGLPWTADLIDRYAEHWDWELLSSNTCILWTTECLTQHSELLNWANLSCSQRLPWSIQFYKIFEKNWFKNLVIPHQSFKISTLTDAQISNLMRNFPLIKTVE
jgi:hypothetical protein